MTRLFEIIYLLLNQKSMTAKELAAHFEVSTRTIYRDIEALSAAGVPVYMSKGRGGGVQLLPGFVLNKTLLSPEERQEILNALQGLKAVEPAPQEQRKTLAKLVTLFGVEQPDWLEVDFSQWDTSVQRADVFSLLKEAIWQRQVVSFLYYNSRGETCRRQVEPLKLVFKGQSWYLYGHCRLRREMRFFKLSRIRQLVKLQQTFSYSLPQSNTVPAPSSWEGPLTAVTLRISGAMGFRVYDEFALEQIQRQPNGDFLVHAQMPSGPWLEGFLLSYGPALEVLEPASLRQRMITILEQMRSLYKI